MSRTPEVAITPAVLAWARVDAALSAADVGKAAGVTAERVHAWEAGRERPTLAQLRAVARRTRRPVAFFLTSEPPRDHTGTPPDLRASKHAVSRALMREIRSAQERRATYLHLNGTTGAWSLWRDDPPTGSAQVRDRLGVSLEDVAAASDANAALQIWVGAVEAQGVLVFQMSGVPVAECRGFALYDDNLPVVVLNGADAPQARCFTLLHELAHLLEHTGALCLLDEDRGVEQRCNRFAARVLMPDPAVRQAAAECDTDAARVEWLARSCRVSPVAAAIRLRDARLVSGATVATVIGQAENAARRAAEQRSSGGPPRHVLQRRNLGQPYLDTVLDALHSDRITVADATYYLETSVRVLDRLEAVAGGGRARLRSTTCSTRRS